MDVAVVHLHWNQTRWNGYVDIVIAISAKVPQMNMLVDKIIGELLLLLYV